MNDPLSTQQHLREISEQFFAGSLTAEDVAAHALDLAAGSLDEYSKIATYRLRDKDNSWHESNCPYWMVGVTPQRWDIDGDGISAIYECVNCQARHKAWWSADVLPRDTRAYFFPLPAS